VQRHAGRSETGVCGHYCTHSVLLRRLAADLPCYRQPQQSVLMHKVQYSPPLQCITLACCRCRDHMKGFLDEGLQKQTTKSS
jgi:hypothetical protein